MPENLHDALIPSDPMRREAQIFPTLPAKIFPELRSLGEARAVSAGEILFEVGDRHTQFIVIEDGEIDIECDACEGTELITTLGPGSFTGEIDMFSNRRALVRGRVRRAGTMIFLDRPAFRRFLATHADYSELVIRAFILRRMALLYHQQGDLVLIGGLSDARTLALRAFLARNGHPVRFIDRDADPARADIVLTQIGAASETGPVVIYRKREVLRAPTPRQVADILGLSEPSGACEVYDVAIVGMGPAGLAAAVNAAAEGLSVIALERHAPGGQAGTSSKIENYPAFPTGISGQALGGRMMLQAQKFGTEIVTPRPVQRIDCDRWPYQVEADDGFLISARSIVIATGAKWRRLGLAGEDRFENQGVYYGATAVEAALCEGQDVVIVGGGNSAGQAAVFLAGRARHVHILVRGAGLTLTMSDYLIQRIEADPKITLHPFTEVIALTGDERLRGVEWRGRDRNDIHRQAIGHLFVMIGAVPNTEWLNGCLLLDDKGFVRTGSDLPVEHLVSPLWHANRLPYVGEASRPGVFAVGDVRAGSVKRVASAVGEGAIAAQYLYRVVHPDEA